MTYPRPRTRLPQGFVGRGSFNRKDEFGALAKRINEAASNLRAMVTEVRSASDMAGVISVKVKDISRHLLDVSSRQGEGLDNTVSLMEGVQNIAVDLSRAASGLDSSVAKCADSMLALGGRIHEVEESMDALFVSSVDTVRSTKAMSIATREISEHIGTSPGPRLRCRPRSLR